jgi:hypothetical protein
MKENSGSLRVEVSLFVLSPETEHRGEVEVATIEDKKTFYSEYICTILLQVDHKSKIAHELKFTILHNSKARVIF